MGLRDFIDQRVQVRDGDRAYTCRRPTVATVHLVLGLYAPEIAAFLRLEDAQPQGLLTACSRDAERARVVLDTCVDGLGEATLSPSTAEMLAASVLSISDVDRILGGLDIDVMKRAASLPGNEPDEQDEIDADDDAMSHETVIVSLAIRFNCSPSDIMGWPYEQFLGVCEAVQKLSAQTESDGDGEGVPLTPGLNLPGVTFTRVPPVEA